MKIGSASVIVLRAVLAFPLLACGVALPAELVSARETYARASTGIAARYQPVGLHEAKEALDKAEEQFSREGDSPETKDLAYVASPKAEKAEVEAGTAEREANLKAGTAEVVAATPRLPAPAVAVAPAPVLPPTETPKQAAPAYMNGAPQPNAYAVVVGIEKYSGGFPPPTGARADAEHFANLVKSSLGVAADHVQLVLDDQATKGGVQRAIEWAKASVPPGGRIYFYFSGHGAPDPAGGASYLVPADGDPKYLDATAIAMKDVLAKLGQSKAREVLALVDSCFSGAGGRSVLPPGARPLVRLKEEAPPAQLAILAASSGAEISGPSPGGSGGLFTEYVLAGLGSGAADINGDGQVSLGELVEWVKPRVAREAKKDNRDQNPSLSLGKGLGSADGFIVEWGLPAR